MREGVVEVVGGLDGYSDIVQSLLRSRGILDKGEAERFLKADFLRDSHNPFLLQDMRVAAERVVQAAGLTGPAADALRARFEERFAALLRKHAEQRLAALERVGIPLPKPARNLADDLLKLCKLGAFSDGKYYDLARRKMNLPVMTDELAREIVRRANDLEKYPRGNLRDREANRLLNFVLQQRGLKLVDLPMGIFYANALSGMSTLVKIPFENANLFISQTVAALLARPGELLHPLSVGQALFAAIGRGEVKGALQAADTLRSGIVTGLWERPREPGILELKPFQALGRKIAGNGGSARQLAGRAASSLEAVNVWKWFSRAVSTAHETTFKPSWEVKQTLLARDIARREKLRGRALEQRVADLMANTEQAVAEARAQAWNELKEIGKVDRIDLARRTREILEQRREGNMPGSTAMARDYALRTAYLNEPYGLMGLLATGLRQVLEKARQEHPVLGTGVKAQIPFVSVVSNILNEAWNWGPGGIQRGVQSQFTGNLYGRTIMDRSERAEMYAKGIVGTIALGTLAGLYGDRIHGNGPADPRKRKQLLATGWIPNSIEWPDGHYHSLMHTPLKFWGALLGNYQDWKRYGKGEDADAETRLAFVIKAMGATLLNQGMLDSVRRALEALGDQNTAAGGRKLEQALARSGSSFLVPNLVQQIDRLFDPTQYDQTGTKALLTSQIPFVRRENRPVLNVLGEPIQTGGPFHYWASKLSQDRVLRTLAEKQVWVPEMGRGAIIGDKKQGPDHYRAITPEELYDLTSEAGPKIRDRLERALDNWTRTGNKMYRPLTAAEQSEAQALVNHIAAEEHARAKRKLRL